MMINQILKTKKIMKNNKEIKYINVEDIEDIVTSKINIDSLLGEKSDLDSFINTYCMVDNMYSYHGKNIFFKIFDFDKFKYIFYVDESHKSLKMFQEKLSKLNYSFDTLHYIDFVNDNVNIFNDESEYFIIDNKYAK